nr:MAG TPA: hypothetical protein [Caudoviricetes sp.]
MMIERLFGSIFQRHAMENALAQSRQNAADITYLAMMTDVELEQDEEMTEGGNADEVEEI